MEQPCAAPQNCFRDVTTTWATLTMAGLPYPSPNLHLAQYLSYTHESIQGGVRGREHKEEGSVKGAARAGIC